MVQLALFSDINTYEDPASTPPPVFYTGDTYPPIETQFLRDDGSGPMDLTGSAVSVTIAPVDVAAGGIAGDAADIIDAPNGIVRYVLTRPFSLPPTVAEARFEVQFTANLTGGHHQTGDPFPIIVKRRVGSAG